MESFSVFVFVLVALLFSFFLRNFALSPFPSGEDSLLLSKENAKYYNYD